MKSIIKALNAVNGGGYISGRAWAYAWYAILAGGHNDISKQLW